MTATATGTQFNRLGVFSGNNFLPYDLYWQSIKEYINKEDINRQIATYSHVEDFYNNLVANNIFFENELEVKNFLSSHQSLIDDLIQIPEVLKKYFGDKRGILKLSYDPDTENDEPMLFLYIPTELDVDEADSKLKKLLREWLFSIDDENIADFGINLLYQ